LQLEGASLADLEAQIRFEHGGRARFVSVDRVTVGGIRGLFARSHYEVTVELPDPVPTGPGQAVPDAAGEARPPGPAASPASGHADAVIDLPARVGIAALLSDAEQAEAELNLAAGPGAAAVQPAIAVAESTPSISTGSERFARLLEDLTANTAPAASPRVELPPGSRPLHGPGDLVLVVGVGEDALIAARSMAGLCGVSRVSIAGALAADDAARVESRQGALAARVRGVREGHSVFVAIGLGAGAGESARSDVAARLGVLSGWSADQVWVAVDEHRAVAQTAAWVSQVAAKVPVDAVAIVGS
jgi:hypothetical protein